MACQVRLPTKNCLKFGVITDRKCVYFGLPEICDHLFFECEVTKIVWKQFLKWINTPHNPNSRGLELQIMCIMTSGKGCKKKTPKTRFHINCICYLESQKPDHFQEKE